MTGAGGSGQSDRMRPVGKIVALVAGLTLAVYLVRWVAVAPIEIRKADYAPDHRAAVLASTRSPVSAYDYAAQAELNRIDSGDAAPTLPYDYPPASLLTVLPLSMVGLDTGYRLWSGGQLLLLLAGVGLALRASPWARRSPLAATTVIVGVLAGPAVYANLIQGQWMGIDAFGLGACYALWRRGHAAWGVAVLTACVANTKPQLGLGIAVWLLAQRRPQLLGAAVGAVAVSVAVGLALIGPSGFRAVWDAIALVSGERPISVYIGLPGTATTWAGTGLVGYATAATLDAAALAIIAVLGDRLRRGGIDLEVSLAGAIAVTLAVSPHLWQHDLAILAPAAAWLCAWALGRDRPNANAVPLLVVGWILVGALAEVDVSGPLPAFFGHPTSFVLAGLGVAALFVTRGTAGNTRLQSPAERNPA